MCRLLAQRLRDIRLFKVSTFFQGKVAETHNHYALEILVDCSGISPAPRYGVPYAQRGDTAFVRCCLASVRIRVEDLVHRSAKFYLAEKEQAVSAAEEGHAVVG